MSLLVYVVADKMMGLFSALVVLCYSGLRIRMKLFIVACAQQPLSLKIGGGKKKEHVFKCG